MNLSKLLTYFEMCHIVLSFGLDGLDIFPSFQFMFYQSSKLEKSYHLSTKTVFGFG